MFKDVKAELGVRMELQSLDVETGWSSIFNMIRKSYAARQILSDVFARQKDLADLLGKGIRMGASRNSAQICGV